MISYYAGQSDEVADVFHQAIHQIAIERYTPEQVNAWSPEIVDYVQWKWRCELKRPFLYIEGDRVAGFLELDADGHIDCHYVHPDFSRQGIGSQLLRHALAIAEALCLERLYVEASHLAKGLYTKHGFHTVRKNVVTRRV